MRSCYSGVHRAMQAAREDESRATEPGERRDETLSQSLFSGRRQVRAERLAGTWYDRRVTRGYQYFVSAMFCLDSAVGVASVRRERACCRADFLLYCD